MTYPGLDRSKPPGIIPGMIEGHPALHPDGRMKGQYCIMLQRALIAEYTKEDFQKKLYAGWHATDELIMKHQWRVKVSMEIQCGILPRYGFDGSRKGVYASGVACNLSEECQCFECGANAGFMEWLVNPDMQESGVPPGFSNAANWVFIPPPKEGERPASGYHICLTSPEDELSIFEIAHMQGVLAGAHQAMYKDLYPDLDVLEWFDVLGINMSISEALERGVLIYHAKDADTGRVIGYISCTCRYGASGLDGASQDAKPHGQINNIVVLDQHRGHGVGKLLFNELLDHLCEACPSVSTDLRIVVADRNTRAKDWYQRLGFAPVSEFVAHPGGARVRFEKLARTLDTEDFDDLFAA